VKERKEMGGYKRISKEIKDEVLAKVRQGHKVPQLAAEYGISVQTIYAWLQKGVEGGTSALELSKLKRERDDLLKLVGTLTLEVEKRKKSEVVRMLEPTQLSKVSLAKELGVTRSLLYYTPKLPARDEEVNIQIEAVLKENPEYGHKRIAIALKLNKKRILRVMKKFGIKPRRRHVRTPKKLDDLRQSKSDLPNISRLFCPIREGIVWASDFTYLYFQGRFFYLATLIDVWTREIVGYHLSRFHTSELILVALSDALSRHPAPLWVHSDQGSKYRSISYQQRCVLAEINMSMSDKGSPWQNPYQESFYDKFKVTLGFLDRFTTLGELVAGIHEAVYYYNNQRIHSALKMSPIQYKEALTKTMMKDSSS
jgi:transposase InsO family protein